MPLESATLYWSGGDGTWNTTLASWTTNSDLSGPFQAWVNASLNAAVFSGTAGTVSLGVPVSAGSLAFGTDGYAITGNTITLSAATSLDSSTGTQTIGSVLAGAATSLTKTGAGTIKLTGANAYLGATIVSGGTLAVRGSGASIGVAGTSASTMSVGSAASATLSIENGGSVKNTLATLGGASGTKGTVLIDGAGSLWAITQTTGTPLSITSGGSAALTISNGGKLTLARVSTFSPATGQTADLLVQDANSALTSTSTLTIGGVGTTTVTIKDGGKLAPTSLYFGGAGTTTVAISGGGLLTPASLDIGNSGTGGVRQTDVTVSGAGSVITSTGGLLLDGGTNSLTISNGAVVTTGTSSSVGSASDSVSTVTVGGSGATLTTGSSAFQIGAGGGTGTLNLNAGGIINVGSNLRLGNGAASKSVVNQSGGTLTISNYLDFDSGVPEYHLLGGTLVAQDTTGGVAGIYATSPTSYIFELGGGTVQAGLRNLSSNVAATLKTGTTSTLSTPLSASQVFSWQGILSGSGTLRKTGAGILLINNASNSYSGGTTLEQGILNPAVSGALGTGALTITGNSTVQLPNSQAVTVTLANPITINSGVTATMSIQNRSLTLTGAITGDGSLIKSGGSLLVLSGVNTYTGATTISAGIVRSVSTTAFSPASNLQLNGGVIEVGAGGSTAFAFGTGGGQLQWIGSGGFSVAGADRTIDYEGDAALTWGATNFVPNASALILSSIASDGTTFFPNDLDLAGGIQTVEVDSGAAAIDATLSGVLSDGGLIKSGAGTLALTGANTHAGGTTITGGALLFSAGSLGTGSTTVNGGELQWASGNTEDLTLGGRALTLGSNGSTFNIVGAADNVALTGTIDGAGAFAKSGPGTITLSGTNTFGGSTATLNAGTLVLAGDRVLPGTAALVLNGGTLTASGSARTIGNVSTLTADSTIGGGLGLTFGGALTNSGGNHQLIVNNTGPTTLGNIYLSETTTARTLTLSGTGNTVVTGIIANRSGAGTNASSLIKAGSGTLTLSGANTYTGTTTVSAGTLRATSSASALGTGAATLVVSGSGAVELANDTGLNFARNTTVSATTANFTSDVLTDGHAGVTHTLGTLSIGAQTLVLNKGSHVGSGPAGLTFGAVTLSVAGATFTANVGTQLTLGAISGTGRGFSVSGDGNTTIGGNITTTTGTLAKSGPGTLTLSGANTYTGATTISGGLLEVTGSTASGSAISVNSTGTLGGSGTVNGAVAVNSGGLISPGNDPGTLTTGAETWAGGAGYVWELNNASDAAGTKGVSTDWLNSAGALSINSTSDSKFTIYVTSLTAANAAGATPGFVSGQTYQWVFATASSGITNFRADKFAIDTSAFFNDPANVGNFSIVQVGNNLDLTYTAIPEPSTYAVGIAALLGVAILQRRRRRTP